VQDGLRGEHRSVMRARNTDLRKTWLGISRGSRLRVTVVMPVEWQNRVVGTVLLERTPASVLDTLWGKRSQLGFAAAGLLLLVMLLAFITAYFISGPIHALRRQVEQALAGSRGAVTPLSHSGTVEMRQLSEDVAELAQALEHRADYINRFAAQVSHEFKTPLTALRGAVELLRDHADEMPVDQRERFLDNLLADTDRLEKLVSRLLELARADVLRPSGESCDLKALVLQLSQHYAGGPLGVEVNWANAVPGSATIAAELAGSVFSNLLNNALQHGASRVAITAGREAQMLCLSVRDNGVGISPAHAEKVFDAFFTTARSSGGTGLGLPTARALLEAHGGSLWLVDDEVNTSNADADFAGAHFELRIPMV